MTTLTEDTQIPVTIFARAEGTDHETTSNPQIIKVTNDDLHAGQKVRVWFGETRNFMFTSDAEVTHQDSDGYWHILWKD